MDKPFWRAILDDIVDIIKKKPLIFTIILGVFFILLETVTDSKTSEFVKGINSFFHTCAVAIFGAGVFAVLLKSNQFSELFKDQITKVIYTPGKYQSESDLLLNWKRLSEALLSKVLQVEEDLPIDFIRNTYFNHALEYHFEDYVIDYTLKWKDPARGIVELKSRATAKIIPSKNCVNPKFKFFYKVNDTVDGSIKVERFKIGDIDYYQQIGDPKTENDKKKTEEIVDLVRGVPVELDRIIISTQSQRNENFIKGKLIRYVKGFTVKFTYETNNDYPDANIIRPRFEAEGFNNEIGASFQEDVIGNDKVTYEWRHKSLLLPNQGYIILLYEDGSP